jgi:hypothetical protein
VQTPAAKGAGGAANNAGAAPPNTANNAGAARPNTANNANAGIRGNYLKQSGNGFDSNRQKK